MTNAPAPELRLDFYGDTILLSRRAPDGRVTTYPVAAQDVARAGSGVALSSGVLPPGTLFQRQRGSEVTLGLFVAARRWTVQTETQRYRLPLPPLLFTGCDTTYRVFAVTERPRDDAAVLYRAPCPNVHANGTICRGNVPFPPCTPATITAALALFLEGSAFNGHLAHDKCRRHPDDVRRLWAALDGRRRFPRAELVPDGRTLDALL